ncbi:MAG: NAD(P)H-hydrate epimerase [Planctomycetes bacterium]|nr:NAD(P)H-hydrate epimerase [Planctomycetota bacterium]
MRSLDREDSVSIDRRAQEELRIPGELLMENAGAHVARAALALAQAHERARVVVVAGPGNNGGDGFVAARHLLDLIDVEVLLVGRPERLKGDALANFQRLAALGEKIVVVEGVAEIQQALARAPAPLVIDALFGTGLARELQGLPRQVIEAIVAARQPVLAIDLPSGLDCDTGAILGAAIRAEVTVTFVAPKNGFSRGSGPECCGRVEVAPIGFPPGRLLS